MKSTTRGFGQIDIMNRNCLVFINLFQELKEIDENCSIVKEIKTPLHPEILENYEKTWYEKINNKKIKACNPIQHKRNFHGINWNKFESNCKHTEKKMRNCTLCKTCNNKSMKQACELRKCIYKTGKKNIISFTVQKDKIIKLLLRGILHTQQKEVILQIK